MARAAGRLALAAAAALTLAAPAAAQGRRTLRVCADPNNLPFSSAHQDGLENAVAQLVAGALGAELSYTWAPQRRGFVRSTLAAGRCDVMMAAPVGYAPAATTQPYYRSSYVFVFRRRSGLALRSFDDAALRRLRIGVQTIGDDYANTPPAAALARRGLAARIVGFPVYGDYGRAAPQRAIIDAVADGSIDVAVVWGPLAGWFAPRAPVPLTVVPVAAGPGDPALAFDIAMAVRRDDRRLRDELDALIATHRPALTALLRRMGVPLVADGAPPAATVAQSRRR